MRMLQSGEPAARSALVREGVAILMTPLDLLLQALETKLLTQTHTTDLPIILVVGLPRSGSTLVYQTLAQSLPVSFFTNLSALFPRAPITISRRLDLWCQYRSPDFHNFYGNTPGWAAPNDGFHIWNRWLGQDRYTVPQQLSLEGQVQMRTFFTAWLAVMGQPLLNKNNRNTAGMSLLSQILDNLWFIVVHREPLYVAQSLLIAREKVQGNRAISWGLGTESAAKPALDPFEDVAAQVARISQDLALQQLQCVGDRLIEVSYEQFCADPRAIVCQIYKTIWGPHADPSMVHPPQQPFQCGNRNQLPLAEFQRLQAAIDAIALGYPPL